MPVPASSPADPAGRTTDLGELSPKAIRAGLLPTEVENFDAQFRSAMTEAADSLDLTGVLEFLRHWRLVAASSTADPRSHAQIMTTAARVAAAGGGKDFPAEPWSITKARLGL